MHQLTDSTKSSAISARISSTSGSNLSDGSIYPSSKEQQKTIDRTQQFMKILHNKQNRT